MILIIITMIIVLVINTIKRSKKYVNTANTKTTPAAVVCFALTSPVSCTHDLPMCLQVVCNSNAANTYIYI